MSTADCTDIALTNNPCCVETLDLPALTEDGLPTTGRGEILLVANGTTYRFNPCAKGLVWMDGKGGAIVCENVEVNLPQWLNYLKNDGRIVKDNSGVPLEGLPPVFPYLLIGTKKTDSKGNETIAWKKVRGASGEESWLHWNGSGFEFAGLYDAGVATKAELLQLSEVVIAGWKPLNAAQKATLDDNPGIALKRTLAMLYEAVSYGICLLRINEFGELVASPLAGDGFVELKSDAEPVIHAAEDVLELPPEDNLTYVRVAKPNSETAWVEVPQDDPDAGKLWVLGISSGLPAFEQIVIPT